MGDVSGGRRVLRQSVIALVVAAGACAALWAVMGVSLGLFFGGVLITTLLVPYVVALQRDAGAQLLLAGCVVDGVSICWLAATIAGEQVRLIQWVGAYALLLAVALVLTGATMALRTFRSSAPGVALLLMLLWLGAPVWMLHHLQGSARQLAAMQQIINLHPLFALNGLITLSIWSESPATYQLMNLNQDVFYSMPASPIPAILLHAGVGMGFCLLSRIHRDSDA